ncbi:MAG: hypothetical protein ACFFDI_20965, partial [Promethearchaeota archaeon]
KWDKTGRQVWNRTWSDTKGVWEEEGQKVVVDFNGSIYTIGSALAKWDVEGNQLWNHNWDGQDVALDFNGNVYVVGTNRSEIPALALTKWDAEGNQLWNRNWRGSKDAIAVGGHGIAVSMTGQIYTIGYISNDFLLVKWDIEGNQLWNRTWGGPDIDWGYGIAIGRNETIYTVGYTQSFGRSAYSDVPMSNGDLVLVKWDSMGNQLGIQVWDGGFRMATGFGVTLNSEQLYCVGSVVDWRGMLDLALVSFSFDYFTSIPFSSNIFLFPGLESFLIQHYVY